MMITTATSTSARVMPRWSMKYVTFPGLPSLLVTIVSRPIPIPQLYKIA